jgi:hypothetical protein
MDFQALRELVTELAKDILTLVKKDETGYRDDKATYTKPDGTVLTDAEYELVTIKSGSSGEYYPIKKSLKKGSADDRTEYNLAMMAVNLRNTENQFGKKAFSLFDAGSKIIDLIQKANQPLDPEWSQKFLDDLGELASAFQTSAERNRVKYENWSAEELTTSASTDTKDRVWRPV